MAKQLKSSIYRFLSRIPNYTRRFGLFKGLVYCTKIELSSKEHPKKIIKIHAPDSKDPYFLRCTRSDRSIFWQCIVQKQYDVSGFPQYEKLVKHYDLLISEGREVYILDCGANIGLSVRELSNMFPLAKIIAVEPDNENINILKRNIIGIEDKITIVEAAVWSKECRMKIINRDQGAASYQVTEITGTPRRQEITEPSNTIQEESLEREIQIRAITVDKLLKDYLINELLIAKFDIEGAQKEVFKAETDWLERVSLTLIELDDWLLPWQGSSRPFISAISRIPSDFLLKGELLCVFKDQNNISRF